MTERSRRHRPDAEFRRRALGIDPPRASPAPGRPDRPDRPRSGDESLREALARIPDLAPAPSPPTAASDAAVRRAAAPPAAADRAGTGDRLPVLALRPPPPWWRRVAFAVTIVALVGAIPLLARTGYELVTSSTDGRFGGPQAGPGDPGFEQLVVSTPTAMVVHVDALGEPVSLTLLALSGEDGGGAVVFVPLDAALADPAFGIGRLRSAYQQGRPDPVAAVERVARLAGEVVNVGIDEVVRLDDVAWAQLVEPVAPLPIDNPEPVEVAGTVLASGPTTLPADLVGPYLATRREAEDDFGRDFRRELAWRAWLAAVAAAPGDDVVPGEGTTGIGMFVRSLAAGPVTYTTLPGDYEDPGRLFVPDEAGVADLVVDAVPVPDPASPGSRPTVRLLNGVEPGLAPDEVTREIVGLGGTVTVVGNASSFDRDETTVVYDDPGQEPYATSLLRRLGGTGEVRQEPDGADDVDLTLVLGRDVLDAFPGSPASSDPLTPERGP